VPHVTGGPVTYPAGSTECGGTLTFGSGCSQGYFDYTAVSKFLVTGDPTHTTMPDFAEFYDGGTPSSSPSPFPAGWAWGGS